ncbi:hypothetical protein F5Y16DRAFT_397595 [Xylariaceae sp. FL0255]|nr:hypothetical protein F5Y16DRAFT_397595 [Xylariaceae sp. FL0255]
MHLLTSTIAILSLHAATLYASPLQDLKYPNALARGDYLPMLLTIPAQDGYYGSWNGSSALLNCDTHELIAVCDSPLFCGVSNGTLACLGPSN